MRCVFRTVNKYRLSAPHSLFVLAFCIAHTHSHKGTISQQLFKMSTPGRILKTATMVVPYVKSQQERNPDTTPSDTTTKPQSSTPATTRKDEEAFSHDLCCSKSISDRRVATEPQLQRDAEGSKTVKAESSASSSSTMTNEGTSSSDLISEKNSAGLRSPMTPEDEREWKRVVFSLVHN